MNDLVSSLRSGQVLVMDGAMGTELMRQYGSQPAKCLAALNITNPEMVRAVHRSYLDAGAEVLLTNTFQANPEALARWGFADRHHEIWQAAIQLARLDYPRRHFVLADIGPIQNLDATIAARILAECVGVNALLLETWSSLDAFEIFSDLPKSVPLFVSFTFQRTPHLATFEGFLPAQCSRLATQCGAEAIGANCGKNISMEDMLEIVQAYRAECELPIFVKPNAGTPTKNGYPHTPAQMAASLAPLLDAGVAMIGGCCGTTPEYIRAFREVIDGR